MSKEIKQTGIKLAGNWKAGWAIDLHTLRSVPLGDGSFDTTYTKIGRALSLLKYQSDFSQLPIIVELAVEFLRTRFVTPYLNVILPVPPTNVKRTRQPVFEIAKKIGETLNIIVDFKLHNQNKRNGSIKKY